MFIHLLLVYIRQILYLFWWINSFWSTIIAMLTWFARKKKSCRIPGILFQRPAGEFVLRLLLSTSWELAWRHELSCLSCCAFSQAVSVQGESEKTLSQKTERQALHAYYKIQLVYGDSELTWNCTWYQK